MTLITILEDQETINIEEDDDGIEREIENDGEQDDVPPFDPTKIRVDTRNPTISLILERIKYQELDLEPDFQRSAGIWNKEAQSRLIESILVRIPLPSFYIDASNDDKWLIVDGQQRLSTLKAFVLDKTLRLTNLEYLKEFNKKSYDELPRSLQRRILETAITVNIIEYGTPENVKFHIFKRINTGGLPLSSQEIRHVLYQGKATQLLKELSKSTDFKETIGINEEVKNNKFVARMVDKEFILRFLAFYITPYMEYTKTSLEDFLNDTMKNINNSPDQVLKLYEEKFYLSMRTAKKLFGEFAFRKLTRDSQNKQRKYPPNKALFEVWSVNLACLDVENLKLLEQKKENVNNKFLDLIDYQGDNLGMQEKCKKFIVAITYGTSQVQRVHFRFKCIKNLIEEIL